MDIFYFFLGFGLFVEENQMCLKLIFTYWTKVSQKFECYFNGIHLKIYRDSFLLTHPLCPNFTRARYLIQRDCPCVHDIWKLWFKVVLHCRMLQLLHWLSNQRCPLSADSVNLNLHLILSWDTSNFTLLNN